MSPFLGYLGGLGVLPVEDVVRGPGELLLEDFRRYLLQERGLAVGSVELYEGVIRLFLAERSEPLGDDLARLSGGQITAFVLREAERRSGKSAETVVLCAASAARVPARAGLDVTVAGLGGAQGRQQAPGLCAQGAGRRAGCAVAGEL
jgi:hypothetical protein